MTSDTFDESQLDGPTFAGLALEFHRTRCFATLARVCMSPSPSTDARLKVALKLLGQKCEGGQDAVDPAEVRQRFIESYSQAASASTEEILSHLLLAIAKVESQIPDLLPPPPISEEHRQWAHLPPPPVPQSFSQATEPEVSAPRPKEVVPEIRPDNATPRPPNTSRVESPQPAFLFSRTASQVRKQTISDLCQEQQVDLVWLLATSNFQFSPSRPLIALTEVSPELRESLGPIIAQYRFGNL
jgi:hypothetical protein